MTRLLVVKTVFELKNNLPCVPQLLMFVNLKNFNLSESHHPPHPKNSSNAANKSADLSSDDGS